MKTIVLALLLFLFAASADAQLVCIPKTAFSPNAPGSEFMSGSSSAGTVDAYWCPVDGKKYRAQVFVSLNKYNTAKRTASIRRIAAAPDMLTALNNELAVNGVKPAVGSLDEYEFKNLQYMGCRLLMVKPYLVPIVDIPEDFCGAAPIKPK